jgi:hypothetical protein
MTKHTVLVRFFKGKKLVRETAVHCENAVDAELTKLAFTVFFGVPIAEAKVSVVIADNLESL